MMESYTLEEVGKHTSKDDAWVVLHNRVYNVSRYLDDHPGGAAILVDVAGTDATAAFEDVGHSDDARDQLGPFLIGTLSDENRQDEVEAYKVEYLTVKAAPVLRKKSSPLSRFTKASVRALAVGSAIYFGVRSYHQKGLALPSNHRLLLDALPGLPMPSQSRGTFWNGFATATAASIMLFGTFGVFVQHALEVQKDFTIFPPRVKSKYRVYPKKKKAVPVVAQSVLHPREYRKFVLASKEKVSPNVYRFVFALPDTKDILGLPIGQHIAIRAGINGQAITRSYTPTSNDSDIGRLELVIKVYPNGLLTNYLARLNPGDQVEIRGPKGAMRYHKGLCRHIGMIAGGTGITPMYQLIRAICEDQADSTTVSLLYANQTEDDILMREELDGFAKKCPDKFNVWYVLNTPPDNWRYSTGFITKELIKEKFPEPSLDSKAMLCGPPGMVNAMKNNLVDLGFEKPEAISKATDQIFVF